jgi:hypothetical protein
MMTQHDRRFLVLVLATLWLSVPTYATAAPGPALPVAVVIDAAESVAIGEGARAERGEVQVRAAAPAATKRVRIGAAGAIDPQHPLRAQSVDLSNGATVGAVFTDELEDNGGHHGPVSPFVMPPPQVARPPAQPGNEHVVVEELASRHLTEGPCINY